MSGKKESVKREKETSEIPQRERFNFFLVLF